MVIVKNFYCTIIKVKLIFTTSFLHILKVDILKVGVSFRLGSSVFPHWAWFYSTLSWQVFDLVSSSSVSG